MEPTPTRWKTEDY